LLRIRPHEILTETGDNVFLKTMRTPVALSTKNAIEAARLSLPCQARGLSYKSRYYISFELKELRGDATCRLHP
jgi:hypothetical protein